MRTCIEVEVEIQHPHVTCMIPSLDWSEACDVTIVPFLLLSYTDDGTYSGTDEVQFTRA